ncbi:hypothetical protein HELRODRAFT_177158 [Helobdella robusta]|uniref:Uncharacterized protein n=1 Tax=Helobdella robusta TaxID=6412 RepID=T1FBA4_HELRO|nr:hypothetical protein HELRODRAFT_177158 [Helobdella robusta]ESN98276.1 hypothetical protein HELRODRAFT_177158 [Helobdella robusta]
MQNILVTFLMTSIIIITLDKQKLKAVSTLSSLPSTFQYQISSSKTLPETSYLEGILLTDLNVEMSKIIYNIFSVNVAVTANARIPETVKCLYICRLRANCVKAYIRKTGTHCHLLMNSIGNSYTLIQDQKEYFQLNSHDLRNSEDFVWMNLWHLFAIALLL